MTTISPNKVVKTLTYKPKKVEVKQDYLTEKLSNYYREFIIGPNPDPMALALYLVLDHGKIAERVISKTFANTPLEAAGQCGYDIDTAGMTLDGKEYGKIEVRARRIQIADDGKGNDKRLFPFINYGRDMTCKREGRADWFFLCGWDPDVDKPVWFRIPKAIACSSSRLTIQKSTRNGLWGWATEYLWFGPTV